MLCPGSGTVLSMPELRSAGNLLLFERVEANVFLLVPNNSGSTLLSKTIAACASVASLPQEGQYVPGFRGPTPLQRGVGAVWTVQERTFTDAAQYNWHQTRKVWAFHARTPNGAAARLFVEKSPPNLLRAEMLERQFPNARFIVMVRNPYATAEGIMRQNPSATPKTTAQHILRCLIWQQQNLRRWPDAVQLSYEQLCADPPTITERLRRAFPVLSDLDLMKAVRVKRRYHEPPRDMNREQIARLNATTITALNRVFEPNIEVLREFDYALLEPPSST